MGYTVNYCDIPTNCNFGENGNNPLDLGIMQVRNLDRLGAKAGTGAFSSDLSAEALGISSATMQVVEKGLLHDTGF